MVCSWGVLHTHFRCTHRPVPSMYILGVLVSAPSLLCEGRGFEPPLGRRKTIGEMQGNRVCNYCFKDIKEVLVVSFPCGGVSGEAGGGAFVERRRPGSGIGNMCMEKICSS